MKQNLEYNPDSSGPPRASGAEIAGSGDIDGLAADRHAMRHAPEGIFSDPHVRHDLGMSSLLGSEVLAVPHQTIEDAHTVMRRIVRNPPSFLAYGDRDPDEVLREERLAYEREEQEESRAAAERRARAQAPLAAATVRDFHPTPSTQSHPAQKQSVA